MINQKKKKIYIYIQEKKNLWYIDGCRGRFCDKGRKCENDPNLPLGSLEVFIYGDSSPKFQMYNEQKANGALTRENQNANNESAEKA